jgi:hypothetical protein
VFRKLLGIVAALAIVAPAGLIVSAPPASAGQGWSHSCDDDPTGGDKQIPILSSPITLALEVGHDGSLANPHVEVCYATTPESYSGGETAGGAIGAYALCQDCYAPIEAYSYPDNEGPSVQVNGVADLWYPTFTVTPGPAGTTGDTITVDIPVLVCSGQCYVYGSEHAGSTGLLVGRLQGQPAPGQYGVSYQLTSLQLWVNGAKVLDLTPAQAGAGLNPFGQVSESLGSPGSPCLLGVCAPIGGYVETTGAAPLLVLQVGGSTVPVGVPKTCLYSNNAPCP